MRYRPLGGLVLASDGLLYGTTKFGQAGQIDGAGSIFKIAPDGTGFQIIYRFAPITASNQDLSPINTNGAYPEAELVEGADGYLYGVARAGGPNGTGTIFKISRDGTDFKLLHSFAAVTSAADSGLTVTVDGAAPTGPLVAGADNFFYGTTSQGGTNGRGAVFRIAFDGTGFQVLHHFSATTADTTTGLPRTRMAPRRSAACVDGGDGFLYGMASQGGTDGNGVIFAIPADGSAFTVLHSFTGADGARPVAELMVASSGKLYGVTSAGGVNSAGTATALGTIFSIDRAGTNFSRLYSFDGAERLAAVEQVARDGARRVRRRSPASAGNCSYGTIFRYSLAGDTVTGNTSCGQKKNSNSGGGSRRVRRAAAARQGSAC